jgi:hypothetical protein
LHLHRFGHKIGASTNLIGELSRRYWSRDALAAYIENESPRTKDN